MPPNDLLSLIGQGAMVGSKPGIGSDAPGSGPAVPGGPEGAPPASPQQQGGAQPGLGGLMQQQQQQQGPHPYDQIMAAVHHFTEVNKQLYPLLKDPDLGFKNCRPKIFEATASLI